MDISGQIERIRHAAEAIADQTEKDKRLLSGALAALPGGQIVVPLPLAAQWQYSYQKEAKDKWGRPKTTGGMATARFLQVKGDRGWIWLSGGPNSDFFPSNRSWEQLIDALGGFDKLLELVAQTLERRLPPMTAASQRAAAVAEDVIARAKAQGAES